jgi:hypothetical protein
VGKDGRKYQEVGPDKMPLSRDDMHFLQEECTDIFLDHGYIFEDSSSSTSYRDSHGQEWSFLKTKGPSAGLALLFVVGTHL